MDALSHLKSSDTHKNQPLAGRQPCDVCSGDSFEQLCGRDRKGRPLDTVICRRCGLVSHATIPSETELDAYYARQYRRDYQGQVAPSAYRVVREWQRGRRMVEALRPLVQPGCRVLEVGCGMGCNVKQMELAGFNASGIEPGEGYCQFARQQLAAHVTRQRLQDLPRVPRYDLVLLVHVLEHLPSPRQALGHIRELLKTAGKLYVEVPNLAGPHAAPGKLFHFAHIYNFTPIALQNAAEASGFRFQQMLAPQGSLSLGMVFERDDIPENFTPRSGYSQAVDAIHRYNTLTYHMRPQYVSRRFKTAAEHLSQRWRAKRRMNAIVDSCRRAGRTGCEVPLLDRYRRVGMVAAGCGGVVALPVEK